MNNVLNKSKHIQISTCDESMVDHERHMCEMLLRMMRGEPVEIKYANHWSTLAEEHMYIRDDVKYRKPVKKLNIPWEHIKSEYKFVAMDELGNLSVFEDVPRIVGTNTYWSGDRFLNIEMLNIGTDGIDWRESLTKRPKGEV